MTERRIQPAAVRQVDRSPGRALRLEQTYLVRTETVIPDEAPDPTPANRKTRRAEQRAARRKNR